MEVQTKILKTNRGKDILVFEDNQYLKEKEIGQKVYWKCIKRKACNARLHTDINYNIVHGTRTKHSGHISCMDEIKVREVINSLKKSAQTQRGKPLAIVHDNLIGLSDPITAALPNVTSLRKMTSRWMNDNRVDPPLPLDRHFEIPPEITKLGEENFLLHDTGREDPSRILVFGTAKGLKDLAEHAHWATDGTFRSCATHFYQLITIHIIRDQFSIARIYAVLPGKSENLYRRVYKILKEKEPSLNPSSVLLDFELANIQALREEFPRARISLCLFHLSQSIFRKAAELGHKVQYSNDEKFRHLIRCLPALAMIPEEDVFQAFNELCDDEIMPLDLASYFEATYLGQKVGRRQNRAEPMFQPSM